MSGFFSSGRDQAKPTEGRASAAQELPAAGTAPAGLANVLGAGRPIDPAAREPMESSFGRDFRSVRIHDDARAAANAEALQARAFTLGSNVAFSPGQYAPYTPEGKKLLAHELTHVVQQSRPGAATIQRAPLKMEDSFDSRDTMAKDIDQAIDKSPVRNYMPKDRQNLQGNFDISSPEELAGQFERYRKAKDLKPEKDIGTIGGFVFRGEKKPIKLRHFGTIKDTRTGTKANFAASTVEVAIHETIHLNSSEWFQSDFKHNYNEGVTAYFTDMVLGTKGSTYRPELELAKGLIAAVGADGEKKVADAYFHGNRELFSKTVFPAVRALPDGGLLKWQKASQTDKLDVETANALLLRAIQSQASAGASSGSGSGSGSGSASGSGLGSGAGAGSGSGSGSSAPPATHQKKTAAPDQ